jgi:hypothetical protein
MLDAVVFVFFLFLLLDIPFVLLVFFWLRSPDEIAAMRQLKAVFDPKNILNPNKYLP